VAVVKPAEHSMSEVVAIMTGAMTLGAGEAHAVVVDQAAATAAGVTGHTDDASGDQ
jgi:fructose transport system ATP-binding protein